MSNFEQTIAVHKCVLLLTGGLRCPDPSNATRALFCLVGVVRITDVLIRTLAPAWNHRGLLKQPLCPHEHR